MVIDSIAVGKAAAWWLTGSLVSVVSMVEAESIRSFAVGIDHPALLLLAEILPWCGFGFFGGALRVGCEFLWRKSGHVQAGEMAVIFAVSVIVSGVAGPIVLERFPLADDGTGGGLVILLVTLVGFGAVEVLAGLRAGWERVRDAIPRAVREAMARSLRKGDGDE